MKAKKVQRGSPSLLAPKGRLALAALLFTAATYWALNRDNRPDPSSAPRVFSWRWWINPIEINARARLPEVSGTLTSSAVSDGSLYLAGQQGIVLRYKGSSQKWERLAIPDSLSNPPPARLPAAAN